MPKSMRWTIGPSISRPAELGPGKLFREVGGEVIVACPNGVPEVGLLGIQRCDLVQCCVAFGDRPAHGGDDVVRGGLELGNFNDGLEFRGARLKLTQPVINRRGREYSIHQAKGCSYEQELAMHKWIKLMAKPVPARG